MRTGFIRFIVLPTTARFPEILVTRWPVECPGKEHVFDWRESLVTLRWGNNYSFTCVFFGN